MVQGFKMPKKAIAKRERRGKGRGKGRGAVNPTRRMAAERLGDKGGRKPAQWAWRVVVAKRGRTTVVLEPYIKYYPKSHLIAGMSGSRLATPCPTARP